jgi:hypothetical protein
MKQAVNAITGREGSLRIMAKPRNPSHDDVLAWVKMYDDGFFLKDIVEYSGVSKNTIVHHLKKAGVELRSAKARGIGLTWDINEAVQMIQEGARLKDVADRFDVDPATIREGLARYRPDIPINLRLVERLRTLEQAAKVADDHGAPDIAAAIRDLVDKET